jgi:lysophospholipase L1-like esterase
MFVPFDEVQGTLQYNPKLPTRYFKKLSTLPTPILDYFMPEKPTGTLRVVVQGGSTAAGFPYYYGASFARMLEARLAATFPDQTIEFINTGLSGINSYSLLDMAPEIIAIDPDLVVIYAGHNEYYGALGVASSETAGQSPALVNTYLRLQGLATVQALSSGIAAVVSTPNGPGSSGTMMERMVREENVPFGGDLYKQGLRQYETNMRALMQEYQRAQIPVMWGTLVSNLRDHAPFISIPAAGNEAEYQAMRQRVERDLATGQHEAAKQALEAYIAQDEGAAWPHFALATLLLPTDRTRAADHFMRAKEYDALRFRAPEAVNDLIREIAADYAIPVVETAPAFSRLSKTGIIGEESMLEHLHPNVEGYFALSDAFYDAICDFETLGPCANRISRRVARKDFVFATRVDERLGERRLQLLLAGWPFKPAGSAPARTDTMQARDYADARAIEVLRKEKSWFIATNEMAIRHAQEEEWHQALLATFAMTQEFPFMAEPYEWSAQIMLGQKKGGQALPYIEEAYARGSTIQADYLKGAALAQMGDMQQAEELLNHVLTARPRDAKTLGLLIQIYEQTDRLEEATQLRQTLRSP